MIHLVVILHFITISAGAITLAMAWLYLRNQEDQVIKALFYADLVFTLTMIMDAIRIYLSKNILNLTPGFWLVFEAVLYLFTFAAIFFASCLVPACCKRKMPQPFIAVSIAAFAVFAGGLIYEIFTLAAINRPIFPLTLVSLLVGSAIYGFVNISTTPVEYRSIVKTYCAAMISYLAVVSVVNFIPGAPAWLIRVPYAQLIYLTMNSLAIMYIWNLMRFTSTNPLCVNPAQDSDAYLGQLAKDYSLTARELEIVSELMGGGNNREIGAKLFVSPNTVKNHIYNIYKKTGVKSRFELMSLVAKRQKAVKSQFSEE